MLLASACSRPATQLVVIVDSDLVDAVRFRAQARRLDLTAPPDEHAWDAGVGVPFSFGVAPQGRDAHARVELDVEALDASGRVLVRRRVRTGFLDHLSLALPVFLADACRDRAAACELDDLTCVDGECVSPDVAPTDLRAYEPGAELRDAGGIDAATGLFDAGPHDAGPHDAGPRPTPDAAVRIPSSVAPAWVSSFGADASIGAIGFGPEGDVYVAGRTTLAATFFGVAVQPGLVVARLHPDGTLVWARSWRGGSASDYVAAYAVEVGEVAAGAADAGAPLLYVVGLADQSTGLVEASGGGLAWSDDGVVGSDVFLAAVDVDTGDVRDVIVIDGMGDESVSTAYSTGSIVHIGEDVFVEVASSSGSPPFVATSVRTGMTFPIANPIVGSPRLAILLHARCGTSFTSVDGHGTGRYESGGIALADTRLVAGLGSSFASGRTTTIQGVTSPDVESAMGHFSLHAVVGLSATLEADWVARVSLAVSPSGGGWPLRTDVAAASGVVWAVSGEGSSTAGQECTSYALEDSATPTSGTTGLTILTQYDETGAPSLAPILLDRERIYALSIATDLAGNVYEAGRIGGMVSLGSGQAPVMLPIGGAPFVASHARDGTFRWAHSWSSQYSGVDAIAVAPSGDVWIAGDAYAGFTLAPSALRATTGGFLVRMSEP